MDAQKHYRTGDFFIRRDNPLQMEPRTGGRVDSNPGQSDIRRERYVDGSIDERQMGYRRSNSTRWNNPFGTRCRCQGPSTIYILKNKRMRVDGLP